MKHKRRFFDAHHDAVLDLMRDTAKEPLSESEIAHRLGLRGAALKEIRTLLKEMTTRGEIVRLRHDHYSLGEPADLVPGRIEILRSGDAFVRPADNSAEVFVTRGNLDTALPHDNVVVRLDASACTSCDGKTTRRIGKVIRILERSKKAITGTLRSTGRFFHVVPIDPSYARNFYIDDIKDATVGDRVVIQITSWPSRHVNPEAEIIEVIGPSDLPSLDTQTIIRHFDLAEDFSAKVLREAEDAPALMDDPGKRSDLRDQFIFTVDPASARDFDDALSMRKDDKGRRVLGVHIADVAHFVQPDSEVDREALQRGNSVYLPDKVLPMLPEQLSNGLCSLRPDADRLAFSVWITFDKDGAHVRSEFARSIIRSRLRLTYEQNLEILKGGCPEICRKAGIGTSELETIRGIHSLAQQLRRRRFDHDYALDLDMPEQLVVMGPDGMIVDIRRQVNDISHQMIEECMVAANEAVDRELSSAGMAILHRVHEPPDQAKFEQLRAQLLEMEMSPGNLSSRPNLAAFLKKIVGHPFEYDAKVAVLKSMKRALYSPKPLGHYGLAKKYYAHFTSPIRRYPDLVAHRILAARLARRRNPCNAAELTNIGAHCSATEYTAEQAERTLLEIKKYRFLEQQLTVNKPVTYEAVVAHVSNFGMFVELLDLQLQGLVHVSSISNKFVQFNQARGSLRDGRVEYRRGSRVNVRVSRVNLDKRQVDFILVGDRRVQSKSAASGKQGKSKTESRRKSSKKVGRGTRGKRR